MRARQWPLFHWPPRQLSPQQYIYQSSICSGSLALNLHISRWVLLIGWATAINLHNPGHLGPMACHTICQSCDKPRRLSSATSSYWATPPEAHHRLDYFDHLSISTQTPVADVVLSRNLSAFDGCHRLSADHLNSVFHALVVSRILYALPAWGVFLNAGPSGTIDAILKRAYKCGFSKNLITVTELLTQSSTTLFRKIRYNPPHCISTLLPPQKSVNYSLRNCDFNYKLPHCTYTNHKVFH